MKTRPLSVATVIEVNDVLSAVATFRSSTMYCRFALFGLRWVVETNLKHLKQTLKMDILRCTMVEGVLKELTLFVLVDTWCGR